MLPWVKRSFRIEVHRRQEHLQEDIQQSRRCCSVEHRQPLDDHQNTEIAKERAHEENLRNELKPEVVRLPEVNSVSRTQRDPQTHLSDSHENGHFHFQGVVEVEGISRCVPIGVDAERVNVIPTRDHDESAIRHPSAGEQRHADAERFVVHEAGEDGEDGHHDDHVSACEKHGEHLAQVLPQHILLVLQHPRREDEHQQAVANVTEHDSEEEGEGDDGEDSGVGLLVPRHTVCIHDVLKRLREFVRPEVRRWGLVLWCDLPHDDGELALPLQDRRHVPDIGCRTPSYWEE